jgi:hypothetical protein
MVGMSIHSYWINGYNGQTEQSATTGSALVFHLPPASVSRFESGLARSGESSWVFKYDRSPFCYINVAKKWKGSVELFPEDWQNLSEYHCQSPSLFEIVDNNSGTMEMGPPRPPRPPRLTPCLLHITSASASGDNLAERTGVS